MSRHHPLPRLDDRFSASVHQKAYKDEPSFRDAKVIFSLYEDDFKQPFHADFSNKLLLKGIAKKDIAGLKEPIDYTALCKLAADFSDGIIQQSEHVNEEVLNYARESGNRYWNINLPRTLLKPAMTSTTRYGKQNKNKIDLDS